MEPENYNNHNNFEKFVKLQKQIIESYADGANVCKSALEPDELFRFLNEHFKELHQKENFSAILAFVHRCLKAWISRGDYLQTDIGILLVNFWAEHRGSENDIKIVAQLAYQLMNSIKYFGRTDIPISGKLLHEIFQTMPILESRTLASKCTACIQIYLEMFPQNKENLEPLWLYLKCQLQTNLNNGLTKTIDIDILMQLIDNFKSLQSNFHAEPILINTIQHLLGSDQKHIRKCGYYLLKKLFDYVMENINTVAKMWMSSDNIQHIERSWILYITTLENLEEEQSHLILPTLENLDELIARKHLPSNWLNILYAKILTHNNNLVQRWSIEFFLKTFTCSDLSAEVLKLLLHSTNYNSLFNYEGYFLKKEYISSFLKGDIKCLLTLFSEIENWKSVPLYIWLESFKEKQLPTSLTFEDILKISSCIRKLQNRVIRKKAINVCQELFKDFKQKMSLGEYVTYIETLYNSGDKYLEHDIFFSKKSSLLQSNPESSIFKQRFYEIFTNTKWDNNELVSFLKDVPVEQHGWLKFAPFKLKLEECDRNYINHLYKMDLNSLTCCDIDKVINTFEDNLLGLSPYDKHELIECKQAAISFYIYERVDFKIVEPATLTFILMTGIKQNEVLVTFAEKLLDKKIDLWFIDELLKYNSKRILEIISHYLFRFYDENVIKKYAIAIWKMHKFNRNLFENIDLLKQITYEWFKVLASQGDKRIEEAFCFNHFEPRNFILETSFLMEKIRMYHNEQFALDLLKYHTDITKKKPRYFENSNEHRVKLRIASCIYYSIFWEEKIEINVLDQIWNIVLNENNQLNIIYIYEYILGKKEFRGNVILRKLKEAQNLTPSQQVSVISVACIYFQTNPTTWEMQNIIVYSLLSLTMGANFQTRLFAQTSLYQLLKNSKQTEEWMLIMKSIEDVNGTKMTENLNDIRLHINFLSNKIDAIRAIFYITNVPFDELLYLSTNFNYWNDITARPDLKCELDQIECCRIRYMNKFKIAKNDDTTPKGTIHYQIQRKMKPVNDLTEPHNLIVYPLEEKLAEMFVVASLIDKLPNLGGIARTCEVLGIKNLVINSKMETEKNNFKNLSMTAEKTLNILEVKLKDLKEFLIKKKLEGFNIVGAEQTCNSETFDRFQFPKKCVLLLGHEKDGIPAPLLGLLDTAVEIPQFGQVRSLNVHVTGALFMWEYCKQHLIQK